MDDEAAAELADTPLPGFERHGVGPGAARGNARPERLDGIDAASQGGTLPYWWEELHEIYETYVELKRAEAAGLLLGAHDPLPLRGGEICDRCDELAVLATEHVWAQHPIALEAVSAGSWRSGVLLWCARHARENQLQLLADGAVVVGTRGST